MNRELPVVLLIDDQLGQVTSPFLEENYGCAPFQWRKSTAREGNSYSVQAAMAAVEERLPAVVLLDLNFGGDHSRLLGLDILTAIRQAHPFLPVIMFTELDSQDNRETVIRCLELGANEYVEKAPSVEQLTRILSAYTEPATDSALYGNSAAIRQLRASIARVAFSGDTSVLVVGPSGSGKELVARSLHRYSRNREGPFVAKNCAHSESALLDSELFGHEKGAFTGAVSIRKGLIEEADGGVLFLDEVADMPMELQGKMLRALETRTFRRIGGTKDLTSRFQLICASNRAPEQLITMKRLREDFYYRVATMTLHMPRLADRKEDVTILAELFLRRFKSAGGSAYPAERFSPAVVKRMANYDWPGNVRELRNVVERSVILASGGTIEPSDLPEGVTKVGLEAPGVASRRTDWAIRRVVAELELAVELKRQTQTYKGDNWKAEFMRQMYPGAKAANSKGFNDAIHRLTHAPWGVEQWSDCPEIADLVKRLLS